jgi:hypothetical protein
MPLFRQSMLLSVTTDPDNRNIANQHTGSWSESHWWNASQYQPSVWSRIAQARASILPSQASIVGWRSQEYVISGNKLLPGSSQSGGLATPGAWGRSLNLPQDGLDLIYTLAGRPNKVRHRLACIPDSQIFQGEFQPTTAFASALTQYLNYFVGLAPNSAPANAVVRDLSQPVVKVLSLTAGGLLTTAANLAAVAGTDYVLLLRVKSNTGDAVRGSYLIRAVTINPDNTFSYQLQSYAGGTVTKPSGLCRIDRLVVGTLGAGEVGRAVIRKIGRPFAGYHGRRSRRSA